MRVSRLHAFVLLVLLATRGFGATPGTLSFQIRDTKGAPVADAVVALIPLDAAAPVAAPTPAATPAHEIGQQNEEFQRYVTVVQAGTRVHFPNQDKVQHHLYSLSKAKKFEFALYNPGQAESVVFDVSGTVTLGCNIHDWMVAYLYVLPTPYFAQSGASGDAVITAPPGHYRLELMHPRLPAPLKEELSLAEGAAATRAFSVTLKPDRRIRRAPDPKAGSYR